VRERTYHDPLHGAIRLETAEPAEALAIALIDSEPFQRLRRIRQLGPAFLTFHGAESSRFTHSLGVLELARQALRQLERHHPELAAQRGVLYAAALWSARLIQEHPALREPLEAFAPGCAEAVAGLLTGQAKDTPAIQALVSSQLDCDRLDYLLRDSYSTGTTYGRLDLERILAALTLAPDGGLAIHPKGLMAVEHYLVVRNLMYRTVYNHRLNVVCNWLLRQAIARARALGPGQVWTDGVMARWLWEPADLDLPTYLANDDIRTVYHLQRWRESGPPELADPCGRLLERRLLKATAVSHLPPGRRLELLAEARRLAEAQGFSAEVSCGLQQRQCRGYNAYKGGLRLWDGERLEALEQRSVLVQSLAAPMEWAWLIHPAEVAPKLRQLISD
jgi:hypothetical protein